MRYHFAKESFHIRVYRSYERYAHRQCLFQLPLHFGSVDFYWITNENRIEHNCNRETKTMGTIYFVTWVWNSMSDNKATQLLRLFLLISMNHRHYLMLFSSWFNWNAHILNHRQRQWRLRRLHKVQVSNFTSFVLCTTRTPIKLHKSSEISSNPSLANSWCKSHQTVSSMSMWKRQVIFVFIFCFAFEKNYIHILFAISLCVCVCVCEIFYFICQFFEEKRRNHRTFWWMYKNIRELQEMIEPKWRRRRRRRQQRREKSAFVEK